MPKRVDLAKPDETRTDTDPAAMMVEIECQADGSIRSFETFARDVQGILVVVQGALPYDTFCEAATATRRAERSALETRKRLSRLRRTAFRFAGAIERRAA